MNGLLTFNKKEDLKMELISSIIKRSEGYTKAYSEKYDITDTELLNAIFEGHLAYLINSQ